MRDITAVISFPCTHQSSLVTISPASATCAQALLYLHCDNHKAGSRPDCVFYLQRVPPRSGSQSVTGHSNRLKTRTVGTRFRIIVSKQNQRKKQKPEFLEQAGTFWQRPTGLFCSRLSHSVRLSPAARRALPATQTVRESMTSPLYHPQDTLKAHSSAGSNARCRWKQRDPSYYSLPF